MIKINMNNIENFCIEAFSWHYTRKHLNKLENVKSRSLDKVIIRYCTFYPAVRHALLSAT